MLSRVPGRRSARTLPFSFPEEMRWAHSKRAAGAGPFGGRHREGPPPRRATYPQFGAGEGGGGSGEGARSVPRWGGHAGSAGACGSTVGAAEGRLSFPAPSRPQPSGLRPPREDPGILPSPAGEAAAGGLGGAGKGCWRFPAAVPHP